MVLRYFLKIYKIATATFLSQIFHAIYLANTKHFCGKDILWLFKIAKYLENTQYGYMLGNPTYDL